MTPHHDVEPSANRDYTVPDDLPGNTEAIVWMQALAKETDFTHNSTDKGAVKPREAKIAAA